MVGFTFCGRHSVKDFGICMRFRDQPQGASGASGGSIHTVACRIAPDRPPVPGRRREDILRWLSQTGTLVFDDEPDRPYTAAVSGIAAPEQGLGDGVFSLVFACRRE